MQRGLVALAVILALTFTLRSLVPAALAEAGYEKDLEQHGWWTWRYADPTLFPGDLAATLYSGVMAPPGHRLVYGWLVPHLGVHGTSEVLSGVILLATILAVLVAGRTVIGGWHGGALALGVVAFDGTLADEIVAGLPRAWLLALIAAGLAALAARKRTLLGLVFLAAVVLYPPAIVNLGLLALVVEGARLARERRLTLDHVGLCAAGVVALAVVLSTQLAPQPPEIGPKITLEAARAAPEFWPGGRTRYFEHELRRFLIDNHRAGLDMQPLHLAVLGALLLATALWLRAAIAPLAWALVATAGVAFVLAHLLAFRLYLPNRYIDVPLHLFQALWIAGVFTVLGQRVRAARPALAARIAGLRARWWVALVVAVALLGGLSIARKSTRVLAMEATPGRAEVAQAIASLPVDTLIAGHPAEISWIPLECRRSVLACEETSIPYFTTYYREMATRIDAMLAAHFASTWDEVDALQSRYGVDVFVVHRGRFEHPRADYFEPFDQAIDARLDAQPRPTFVLADPPPERILMAAGEYVLVRVGAPNVR